MEKLNDRRNFLGASEAAAVVGLSRYRTPFEVWLEKTGQAENREETLAMRVGTALEPVVLGLFEEKTGMKVTDRQKQIVHPDHAFIRATLDGLIEGAVVEAKTTGSIEGWGEEGTDEVPMEYIVQTQVQMALTGYEIAFIPVLIGRSDFRIYRIKKDAELISNIIKRAVSFWDLVQTLTPPTPTSLSDLALAYPRDTGKILIADQELEEAVLALAELKATIAEGEKRSEELEAFIKSFLKDYSVLSSQDGRQLCSWKTQKSSRFDQKTFQIHHPQIFNQYKKESETRVFRLKKGE